MSFGENIAFLGHLGERVWVSGVLQKPLRLSHSHASMAAAFALHGFAGRRVSPAVGDGEQRSANQGDTSPFHKNNLVVTEQLVRRHERIGNAGERLVVLAHEFETLASIDDVRVLEVGGGTACGNPVLLAVLLHQVIVHVRAHNNAEVRIKCPRGRRPHEVTKVLELGFVRVNRDNQRERRVLTVLIALVGFKVRKPCKRVKRKRLRFHFRA